MTNEILSLNGEALKRGQAPQTILLDVIGDNEHVVRVDITDPRIIERRNINDFVSFKIKDDNGAVHATDIRMYTKLAKIDTDEHVHTQKLESDVYINVSCHDWSMSKDEVGKFVLELLKPEVCHIADVHDDCAIVTNFGEHTWTREKKNHRVLATLDKRLWHFKRDTEQIKYLGEGIEGVFSIAELDVNNADEDALRSHYEQYLTEDFTQDGNCAYTKTSSGLLYVIPNPDYETVVTVVFNAKRYHYAYTRVLKAIRTMKFCVMEGDTI